MTGESTEVDVAPDAPPRTLRLLLEYDGSEFSGWQAQPGERTVQGVLEEAARRLLGGGAPCVIGAGRTDARTHAVGQVAHVRTASRIPAAAARAGFNALLPGDVRVRAVTDADPGFHARFSAAAKEYRYHVWTAGPAPPFLARYCWGIARPLDVEAMAEAARLLEGTRDLSSFRAASCSARTPLRTVFESRVAASGPLVVYAVRARAFLQHMVRIVAGTLVRVGQGRLSPDRVEALIEARDRRLAPATAPAHGLFLVRVEYPGDAPLRAHPEPVLTCVFPSS